MADYNIYIHDLSKGAQADSQTKAWTSNESSQTKAWQSVMSASEKAESSQSLNVSPFMAIGRGVTNAIKSHPVVTAAVVVVSFALKVVDTATPFVTRETGDYRFSKLYSDIKAHINNMTHRQ